MKKILGIFLIFSILMTTSVGEAVEKINEPKNDLLNILLNGIEEAQSNVYDIEKLELIFSRPNNYAILYTKEGSCFEVDLDYYLEVSNFEPLKVFTNLKVLKITDSNSDKVIVLPVLEHLESLEIYCNNFDINSIQNYQDSLKKISVSIHGDFDIQNIINFKNIEAIDISKPTKIINLNLLEEFPSLKSLDLSLLPKIDGLEQIQLNKLEEFTYHGYPYNSLRIINNINSNSNSNSSLQKISISSKETLDFSELDKLSDIKDLHISNSKIEHLWEFSEKNQIEKLSLLGMNINELNDNKIIDDSSLRSIDISECKIGDNFSLTSPILEKCEIWSTEIDGTLEFSNSTSLKEIKLISNTFEYISFKGKFSSLEKLSINNCGIYNITFLGKMNYIKELDLRGNIIKDYSNLLYLPNLEKLILDYNFEDYHILQKIGRRVDIRQYLY